MYNGPEGCAVYDFTDLEGFARFTSLLNIVLALFVSFAALTFNRLVTLSLFVYMVVGVFFGLSYTFQFITLSKSELGPLVGTLVIGAAVGVLLAKFAMEHIV